MSFSECRIPATAGNRLILESLDARGMIVFDHFYEADGHLVFPLTAKELRVVRAHGLKPEIVEDLAKTAKLRVTERATARALESDDDTDDAITTGFVDQYLDAEQVATRISDLAAEFPALCHLTTLPDPTDGYDGSNAALLGPASVQLLRLTNDPSDRSRPALLLVCGTHAREWVNPLVAIEFAEQLARNYDPASVDPDVIAVTRILQEGEVLIVPVMNPDGLNFSRHDQVDWRKNRSPNPGAPACPGVDLNRNFEVFFGGAGSSASECVDSFRGPSAFSEPETRNIKFVTENFPNILIAVDSHSAGEELLRPTATGGSFITELPVSPEDELIYQQLETAANNAIQAVTGNTYSIGTTSNHAGTSDEYWFFAHRIFGFDFECALSHQPPIDSGLISAQEVTAALRALATKAIDLDVAAAVPSRIVQTIDRTGSMAAFGYDDEAVANARRFVDLMSIGDSAAVVSFADPSPDPLATPFEDRARVDFPLTALTPATVIQATDEINALTFGGWTSLGAGLQTAAGELSSGSTDRDAIVLLSDGFENREPWASDVLSTFPAGIRVFTIAMGTESDVPLLEQIASETGGTFHMSPSSFDLYGIYNQIRADASDDDLVLNEVVESGDDDHGSGSSFWVEDGVSRLLVSATLAESKRSSRLTIVDPCGRRLSRGDWGYEVVQRKGYVTARILRPMPGRWRVSVQSPERTVVAAFVRSPLQLSVTPEVIWKRKQRLITLQVTARSLFTGPIKLSGTGSLANVAKLVDERDRKSHEWLDAGGSRIRSICAGTEHDRVVPKWTDRASLDREPIRSVKGKYLSGKPTEVEYELRFGQPVSPGVYRADVHLTGGVGNYCRFERVYSASIVVSA